MNVFEKIAAQQAKLKDTEPAWMVGEQLKDICRVDPNCAEIVSQDLDVEAMSIVAAAKKIKAYADKQPRVDNCVCISSHKAEGILREFYGLPEINAAPSAGTGNQSAVPQMLDLNALLCEV